VLRSAELARVRCLVVAPFDNASDAPLAAEAATGALLSGIDGRTKVFPIPELRGLFRDTPLELPEGLPASLALELGELIGADAVLSGGVEGRTRGTDPRLIVTMRLALAGERELLFATAVEVRPRPYEPAEAAVRRAMVEATRPLLQRLGSPGKKSCFDKERTRRLRTAALEAARPARAAAVPPPPPPPAPIAAQPRPTPRTARQAEWAKRLGSGARFVLDDAVFTSRTASLARDGGLADLAVALAAVPDAKIRVEGFVDATPDAAGDVRLAALMAQTVGQRLLDLGVSRERLSWAGRGSESPILPNFTARGRAANRRIEVVAAR
jgi:outer membrane protein OmpA-like peptidoglycan-associated protein